MDFFLKNWPFFQAATAGLWINRTVYDQGLIQGANVFGDMFTSYRDKEIAQYSLNEA